jgi:hypothetical protein
MRASFRPNHLVHKIKQSARRKGHAIAHSPRPASCLRRTVGYLALSLPEECVLEPGFRWAERL